MQKKVGWNPSLHKDPLYVISYYSHEFSRASTIENLKSILHINTVQPGEVHNAFARLPFDTIVTTNYDCLLEKAYKNVGRKYIVIADENQFSTAKINFASHESTLILEIHSDFDHPDKMVITENDFDKYREENSLMTIYFASLMMVRPVLFIGYSLNDPNIRPIWSIINSKLKTLRRQAYSFSARKLDK